MRSVIRLSCWGAFSAGGLLLVPALALAQGMSSGGFGGSSGGFGGNSISSSGTATSFSGGASGFGGGNTGSSSSFFGSNTGSSNTGFTGSTTSPGSGGGRGGAGSVSNPVNQSNVLYPYFATGFSTSFNSSSLTRTMGSFGQPLYKISTPTASAQQVATASVGGRGNSSLNSLNSSNADYGAVTQLTTRRPAVAAMLDDTFPVNVPSGGLLQTELRDILDRSTSLTSQPSISISVEGRLVTLRGVVPNDNERRLAESLLRLTPGVGMIKNELTVRAP
jgi:hypothetical protein